MTAERVRSHRVAVIMGTSTSGIAEGEAAIAQRIAKVYGQKTFERDHRKSATSLVLYPIISGSQASPYTISTACSSSAKVFASAQRLIAADLRGDATVIGGVGTLCRMILSGFDSLQVLSKDYCISVQPQS